MIRTSACLCTLALMLAGCGGDAEPAATTAPSAPVVTTQEGGTAELPAPPTGTGKGSTSPEDRPGGAGDEEPARSEVELRFSRDGLEPPIVRVAPFIAVRLIVRSVDGSDYDLAVNGPASSGGASGSSKADLDLAGLRPGQKYEVVERNTGSKAAIVASDAVGP